MRNRSGLWIFAAVSLFIDGIGCGTAVAPQSVSSATDSGSALTEQTDPWNAESEKKLDDIIERLQSPIFSTRRRAVEDFIAAAVPVAFVGMYNRDIYGDDARIAHGGSDAKNNATLRAPETLQAIQKKRVFRRHAWGKIVPLLKRPSIDVRKVALKLVSLSAVDSEEYHYLGLLVNALDDPVAEVGFTAYIALLRRFPETLGKRELEFNPFEHDPERFQRVINAWRDYYAKFAPAVKTH